MRATSEVREHLRRGRKVVTVLDTLVSAELEADPGRLRARKTAKRIVAHAGGAASGGQDGELASSAA